MNCAERICGVCAACRREDRELARHRPVAEPVTLSARAQAILDEGALYTPQPQIRTAADRSAPLQPTVAQGRESRAIPIIPSECRECGEIRIVMIKGTGRALAGGDGKCELCFERPALQARLAANLSHVAPMLPTEVRRATRRLERTLKDGRPFHEGAVHGSSGYAHFGCRCQVCRDSRAKVNKNRRIEKVDA